MRMNDPLFRQDVIGMPDTHAEVFRNVSVMERAVIVCRAVGPTCLQLLEQGYDTKGFRVHAKSCDWGPMAGFVLRDPQLNKKGAANVDYNTREIHEAMYDEHNHSGWMAATVPLRLYSQRVKWLIDTKRITVQLAAGGSRYVGEVHQCGVDMKYSLRREWGSEGLVYDVYIEEANFEPAGGKGKPMLAMTNPPDHRSWKGDDFRNALTGDYDLFTVWALSRSGVAPGQQASPQHYDHDGDDRRVLGGAQNWTNREYIEHELERNYTKGGQGTKLGNMTNRVYMICQLLNSGIGVTSCERGNRPFGPFPNRMVAWHSDETTRPFVQDVDLPLIAFLPNRDEVLIETIQDFKDFILMCISTGFHVTLGEGWTLTPDAKTVNRLGAEFRHLVPSWEGGQWKVDDWYNR